MYSAKSKSQQELLDQVIKNTEEIRERLPVHGLEYCSEATLKAETS